MLFFIASRSNNDIGEDRHCAQASPTANKTWPAWQLKYRLAHVERKRLLKANPLSFGTANSVSNEDTGTIIGYLDNMANAATNDSNIMASILAKLDALTVQVNKIKQPST